MLKLVKLVIFFICLGFLVPYGIQFYENSMGPGMCKSNESGISMTRSEATRIAKQSVCAVEGTLLPLGYDCNSFSGTWWIGLHVKNKQGCLPACVVNVTTKEADINWRCTGIMSSP